MRKIVEAPSQSVVSIARSFHHFRLHLGIFRAGTTYLPRIIVGFPISARNITAIFLDSKLDTPAFREILCPNQIQCPELLRPRCLSAWYVTRIAAGFIHLQHTFPLPVNRTSTWRLGSDVLASIAYPGIAFTHFSVKLIVASRGKGSYTETQADIFVLESATKLAMVITCHQQPRTLTKNFNWIYFWFGFLFVPIWSAFYSNYLDGP